ARWVQQRLKSLGYYNGLVDGEPRSLTEKAIVALERDYGLTADGCVADNDWYYLLAVE
ncbi:MAG: peptidoglycan-binding protein, partial [Clostridia bacterium]|nr:peptidoglycan-binding protein [Clostridia bacterium]